MSVRWMTGGIHFLRRPVTHALWIALLASTSCSRADGPSERPGGGEGSAGDAGDPASYLYVWAADDDGSESDFVAVIDVRRDSPTYAEVITTLTVGFGGRAHHTEHVMPESGILLANAFDAGLTFLIDSTDPEAPSLAGYFAEAGEYHHPHSFERLPNGNILATFQRRSRPGGGSVETGGLVELDPSGVAIRSGSAAVPELDPTIRPYSLCVVPGLDRVVTTSTDMAGVLNPAVQVWRLSELSLRNTIVLEPGPLGSEHLGTAEPRLLADGRTVIVSTFSCGLYKLAGLEEEPTAELVYSFPQREGTYCALPVVTERFWIHTVPAEHALVALDITDPSRPVEVARLTLEPDDVPHWIGMEPGGERIVITGYAGLAGRVLLARLDHESGKLELEESFREPLAGRPGVDLRRASWPHGDTGPAAPHGAVFSRN
jgi:hypothetical protein